MSKNAVKSVGLVAGGGALPSEIVDKLIAQGLQPIIAAIKGEASQNLSSLEAPVSFFDWGEIGRILKYFHGNDCDQLVLAGSITQRPNFMSIMGDPGTMRRLPKIIKAMRGGDDGLLRRVIKLIEDEGFSILPLSDVAGDLLANSGPIGHVDLDTTNHTDLDRAVAMLTMLSDYDVGQGCVVENGRVLAIEAAEGTDAMLDRVRQLRQQKRAQRNARAGLFVKAAKKGQDLRVDLPTIGIETVENAIRANLAGIAIEAGKVIVLQREQVIKRADESGIALVGFNVASGVQ